VVQVEQWIWLAYMCA